MESLFFLLIPLLAIGYWWASNQPQTFINQPPAWWFKISSILFIVAFFIILYMVMWKDNAK